jgi:inositol phosphorylceramide mannosyltransferase catalytic subunit
MFSTGPMFLSAQFGLYTTSHPPSPEYPGGDVRILPKSLYGKNAKPGEAPNSFFSHHYGSSWHADDAAFITFLGKWGKVLMWVGLAVLIIGLTRLLWQRRMKNQHGERTRRRFALGRYDVVLPRAYNQDGRFHLDLGFVTMAEQPGTTTGPSSPTSSPSSAPPSPSGLHPLLPLSLRVRPSSPRESTDLRRHPSSIATVATHVFRHATTWVRTTAIGYSESQPRRQSNHGRGVMFFLPAIFTPSPRSPAADNDVPLLTSQTSIRLQAQSRSRSPLHGTKDSDNLIISDAALRGPTASSSSRDHPPPPYEQGGHVRPGEWVAGEAEWDEWTGDEP